MKRENTKDKILEKALELFSANGYDSVSVGEIARAVGIKAPSIYNHYPSKQAIFDAIVKETAERYEKFTNDIDIHVQNADADTDIFSNITEEFLIQKVRSIFLYSLHDNAISRFRRMMTIEQFRSAELSELYTNRYVKRLVDYHSGIFKNLISNGEIINIKKVKGFDLSFTGTICVSLSNGTVTYVSRRYVSKIRHLLGI